MSDKINLREVDGGKWRLELDGCRCAFLFEPIDNGKWNKIHVRSCNKGHGHRTQESMTVANLPKVNA